MFINDDKFLIINNNPVGELQYIKVIIAVYLYKYRRISKEEAIEFAGVGEDSFWNRIDAEVMPHITEDYNDIGKLFLELLEKTNQE